MKQNISELDLQNKFSHSAKVQIMKDILSNIFSPKNSILSDRDSEIIRLILIDNKKVREVANKLSLPAYVVSELFDRAVKRANLRYAPFKEQVENVLYLHEEINLLKRKVSFYEKREKKENELFELSAETLNLLKKDIREFNLSARVVNICRTSDIYTLGDLVKLSDLHFQKLMGVGKGSMAEVNVFLASNGLRWRMKI